MVRKVILGLGLAVALACLFDMGYQIYKAGEPALWAPAVVGLVAAALAHLYPLRHRGSKVTTAALGTMTFIALLGVGVLLHKVYVYGDPRIWVGVVIGLALAVLTHMHSTRQHR